MTMHEPNCSPKPSTRDGFIIVAVLWILIALATLASIYSIYIKNSALALSVTDDGLQAEALVSASLELTAYRLIVPKDDLRPTRGRFSFRLGRANVVVDFSSEAARIDLNAAPKALLTGFFETLGASREDADRYADRVIGWRTTPKPLAPADEAAVYRAAGLPYLPRGAPFDFDARPELIAALPGMTPARLNIFLAQREGAATDKDSLARLLGPDQPGATADGSNAFRVRTSIAFDNGWLTGSEAVILLNAADEPFHVLSWRNDVNSDADQPRLATRLR